MLAVVWHNNALSRDGRDKIVMRPANKSPNYKARIIVPALLAAFFLLVQQADAYDLSKFPGKGSKQAWRAAAALYNSGNTLHEEGKHKEAIATYKRAQAIYPFDAACYYNAGVSSNKIRQYENAVQYYRKAVELAPDHADAYYNMGNSLWKLKNFPEAEKAYKKSIALDPKSFISRANLGELYLYMKRPADAKRVLLEAQALPDSKSPKNSTILADNLALANKALSAGSALQAGK